MSTQNFSYGKPGELVIGAPGRAALNEDTVERNWELENYVRNASLEKAYCNIQSAYLTLKMSCSKLSQGHWLDSYHATTNLRILDFFLPPWSRLQTH